MIVQQNSGNKALYVTIPKTIGQALKIRKGTELNFEIVNGQILITK